MQDDTSFLFVNRRPPKGLKVHFVGIDNRAAGCPVVEYFLSQSYTECAIIHGPLRYAASAERAEGFIGRLAEAGITVPSTRRIEARLTIEDGYAQAKRILDRRKKPRALFCGNDQIAYGVYRACIELGIRVHDDLALFGFDDNDINAWLAPWLNTVRVTTASFGPAVANLLSGVIENRPDLLREILLPFELKIRQTA